MKNNLFLKSRQFSECFEVKSKVQKLSTCTVRQFQLIEFKLETFLPHSLSLNCHSLSIDTTGESAFSQYFQKIEK